MIHVTHASGGIRLARSSIAAAGGQLPAGVEPQPVALSSVRQRGS